MATGDILAFVSFFEVWMLRLELSPKLCFVSSVDNYNWPKALRELFENGLDAYRAGKQEAQTMFNDAQREFLDAIGATPQEIFDFVEDTSFGASQVSRPRC